MKPGRHAVGAASLTNVRILVVDDDRSVRDALRRALTLGGYDVEAAEDGRQALARLSTSAPDAVVLDVGMPEVDGLEVCRRLRGAGDRTPVLMLTARDAVADRVAGLDVGADDYLVKPFALEELLARLRALLRRYEPEPNVGAELALGDLRLDLVAYEAWRGDRQIQFTRTEWLPAQRFLANPRPAPSRSGAFQTGAGHDSS